MNTPENQEISASGPSGPAIEGPRRLQRAFWREIWDSLAGIHIPGAVAAVVATVALIISHHHGGTGAFRSMFPEVAQGEGVHRVAPYLYWFGASVALYLLLPLLAAGLTPGIRIRETGVGFGDKRVGLLVTGAVLIAFLPIVYVASTFTAFARHYPLCAAAKTSWSLFLLYELAYAAYFFSWEYLYRGYLLFSLEPSMGKMAVFAQTIPFAIIHFGKPEAETFGAIVAGIFLGLLALRTRSCWYGAIVHITVAVSMDTLTVWDTLVG